MTANVYDITDLFTDDADNVTPVYFDLQSHRQFTHWLERIEASALLVDDKTNKLKAFVKHLRDTQLPVIFFQGQLDIYPENKQKKFRDALESLGLQYSNDSWRNNCDMYASELEKLYFHDEETETSDLHAKFLILTRYASIGEPLRILTAHSSFKRIVDACVYMLPNQVSEVDFPANFDLFTDFELHDRLRKTLKPHFQVGNYPQVMFEAVKELNEYLREITGSENDGIRLIREVLEYDTENGKIPDIKFNPLETSTDWNEHTGYYEFYCGVIRAIRNPSAHTVASDPFITSRFGNAKTVAKFLCFISLLFEKLDQRVSP